MKNRPNQPSQDGIGSARKEYRIDKPMNLGKQFLYSVMLLSLVISGAVPGFSVLPFSSTIAIGLEDRWGMDLEATRFEVFRANHSLNQQ